MRCSQIRKMISPYVDDELTADEETLFTSHVADCPACKKEVDEVQSVRRLFASVERSEAPPGFATRVMAHLEEAEEAGLFSRLRRLFVVRPLFLRTVEIAFALVIMLIGMWSGNMLVADRTPGTHATIQEAFSLDLFEAAPPDSIGGVYMKLAGTTDER